MVYHFNWSNTPEIIDLCVDTDFAGCKVSRRSTSGGVAMRGGHCLRHWASTQTTIALSSGEAELGGLAKGISQGIGLRSIAADLGIETGLRLKTDATAAMGMARRLGVGKVRHLDTALLWVQGHVRSGEVLLDKIPGQDNPGDALTKYLSGPDLRGHLQRMNIFFEDGRPATAPQLSTSCFSETTHAKEVMKAEKQAGKQCVQQCVQKCEEACAAQSPACPVQYRKTCLPSREGQSQASTQAARSRGTSIPPRE